MALHYVGVVLSCVNADWQRIARIAKMHPILTWAFVCLYACGHGLM